ncbi:MAG: hypothetical protein OXF54_14050 [Caldilineaceae bacterium]|nr:hypothetical protein [Caldilineaceae bacterium]
MDNIELISGSKATWNETENRIRVPATVRETTRNGADFTVIPVVVRFGHYEADRDGGLMPHIRLNLLRNVPEHVVVTRGGRDP